MPLVRVLGTFWTKLNKVVEPGTSGAVCAISALRIDSWNSDRRTRPCSSDHEAASSSDLRCGSGEVMVGPVATA